MIAILICKSYIIVAILTPLNTRSNAGYIVGPFVEISIIEIVLALKDVLRIKLAAAWKGGTASFTDGIVTARSIINRPWTRTADLRA